MKKIAAFIALAMILTTGFAATEALAWGKDHNDRGSYSRDGGHRREMNQHRGDGHRMGWGNHNGDNGHRREMNQHRGDGQRMGWGQHRDSDGHRMGWGQHRDNSERMGRYMQGNNDRRG